jgi:predicted DNA-binding transcriptional regulator YafY
VSSNREVIEQVISTDSVVRIRYKDYHGRVTERNITPLEWITFDRIRAWCHLRKDERDFRVDGIVECRPVGAHEGQQRPSRSQVPTGGRYRGKCPPAWSPGR